MELTTSTSAADGTFGLSSSARRTIGRWKRRRWR